MEKEGTTDMFARFREQVRKQKDMFASDFGGLEVRAQVGFGGMEARNWLVSSHVVWSDGRPPTPNQRKKDN